MRKLILFTLLVAWPSAALSQQIYGRLEGAANDAQGLVLPGVTVTLESEELVAARSATTDVDGSYRFAQLVAGSYNLTFELGGFQTVVFEDVIVVGGSTFEVNAMMDIATVAETVTVTGESPVVDVKTTGVSASFDTTQLEDVPVGYRHVGGPPAEPRRPDARLRRGRVPQESAVRLRDLRGPGTEPDHQRRREQHRGNRRRGRLLRLLRDRRVPGVGAGRGRGIEHPGRDGERGVEERW